MKTTLLSKRQKRKYTTDTIIRYKLGKLSADITGQIPKSTRQYWNTLQLSSFFGYGLWWTSYEEFQCFSLLAKHKRLIQVAKSLACIVMLYKSLLSGSKQQRKIIKTNAVEIIKTIHKTSLLIGLKKSLHFIGLSYQQYYAWANQQVCSFSVLGYCPSKHPFQLIKSEVAQIKKYMTDPVHQSLSAASVYCKLKSDKAVMISIGTFYKYLRLLKLQRINPHRRNNKNTVGIRASKPLAMLHMDVSVFKTADNIKMYLYVIQDNFSRAILGLKASLKCCAHICMQNLQEVIDTYGLCNPALLITDDGSENKGKLLEFISAQNGAIKKITAQIDIVQSNSMVEAANKKIKYRFLYNMYLPHFNSVVLQIPIIKQAYNNTPLMVLSAYTPLEVLNGAIPDNKRFAVDIKEAVAKRKQVNQKIMCSDLCKDKFEGSF